MNEETDTPETLADIIAEMRRFAAFAAGRSRITPAPSLAAEQECHAAKLTKYADRLEAAAKREYAETKAYFEKLHDGPSMICTAKNCAVRNIGLSLAAPGNAAAPRKFDEAAFDAAVSKPNGWSDVADPVAEIRRMRDGDAPGNSAAMREALEWAAQFVELGVDDDLGADGQNLTTAAEMARAALSAPVRNCDRFADATEMARAFLKDPYSTLGRDSLVEVAHRFAEWSFAPTEGVDHA